MCIGSWIVMDNINSSGRVRGRSVSRGGNKDQGRVKKGKGANARAKSGGAFFSKISREYGRKLTEIILSTPQMEVMDAEESQLTKKERTIIRRAVEVLQVLESEGKTVGQLKEIAKTLIGKNISLSKPKDVLSIISKYYERNAEKGEEFEETTWEIKTNLDRLQRKRPSKKMMGLTIRLIDQMLESEYLDVNDREDLITLGESLVLELGNLVVEEAKETLIKKLNKLLKRGGSERSISASVSVGAGFGVDFNVELKMSTSVARGDDTKIRTGKSFNAEISVSGGLTRFLSILGSIGGTTTKGTTYKNLEDFVRGADLTSAVLVGGRKSIKFMRESRKSNIKFMKKTRKRKSMEGDLIRDQNRLKRNLVHKGIISPGDTLILKRERRVAHVRTRTVAKSAKIKASVGPVSIFGERVSKKTKFKRKIELQSFIQGQLESGDLGESFFSDNQYLVTVSGKSYGEIHDRFDYLNDRVEKLESTKSHGKKARIQEEINAIIQETISDMEALSEEFVIYQEVVNEYDRTSKDPGVGSVKSSMEDARNSDGRGAFIKGVMLTHGKLKQTLMLASTAVDIDRQIVKDVNKMDKMYIMPNMILNKKARKELEIPEKYIGKQKITSYVLTVFGQDISCTFTSIPEDPNPDNEGDYMTISIPDLQKLGDLDVAGRLIGELKGIVGVDAINSAVLKGAINYGIDVLVPSYKVDFNFIKGSDGKYALQYKRVIETQSLGGEIPPISTGAINVGASASMDFSKTIAERPGTDTQTYFMTVFNGLKKGNQGVAHNEQWENWVTENKGPFKELFFNMAKRNHNAWLELNEMLSALESPRELRRDLRAAIRDFDADPLAPENFDNLLDLYVTALDQYHEEVYAPSIRDRFQSGY